VFTIADGALDKRIYRAVDALQQDRCRLYSEERRWGGQDLPWQLLITDPYLVEPDPEDEFNSIPAAQWLGPSLGNFLSIGLGHAEGAAPLSRSCDGAGREGQAAHVPILRSAGAARLSAHLFAGEIAPGFRAGRSFRQVIHEPELAMTQRRPVLSPSERTGATLESGAFS